MTKPFYGYPSNKVCCERRDICHFNHKICLLNKFSWSNPSSLLAICTCIYLHDEPSSKSWEKVQFMKKLPADYPISPRTCCPGKTTTQPKLFQFHKRISMKLNTIDDISDDRPCRRLNSWSIPAIIVVHRHTYGHHAQSDTYEMNLWQNATFFIHVLYFQTGRDRWSQWDLLKQPTLHEK